MKTFFALLLTCVLGFIPLAAQNKKENKTDREKENLIGAVKKVETYLVSFLSKDGAIVEEKRLWITNSFTAEGRLSERIVYTPEGRISKDMYTYNLKGENIECKSYYTDFKDKNKLRVQTYIHTFDDKGNLLERKVFEHEGNVGSRFVYQYDEKGNEVEYRYYFHTGLLGGKSISTYNDKGYLISRISYKGDNTLTGKVLFVVDDKGQKIEQAIYVGETLRYKLLFEYDEKGRLLQQETVEFNALPNMLPASHDPEPGKVVFIYDDENKIKEKTIFNTNGRAVETAISKYDDKSSEIESSWYRSGGLFAEIMQAKNKTPDERRKFRGLFQGKKVYQYEYDAQGNWTKKTLLLQAQEDEQAKQHSAEQRVITYY